MHYTITLEFDGIERHYETQSYNDAIVLVNALTKIEQLIHSGDRVCLLDQHGREIYVYDPHFA